MSQDSKDHPDAVGDSPYFDASGAPSSAAVQQRIQRLSTATGRSYDEELEHVREDPTRLELSDEQRADVLAEELQRLSWQGYQIVSQTGDSAELVKPKKFRVGLALVLFLVTFGIGLIVYAAYFYLLQKDEHAQVHVDALGQITATGISDLFDSTYAASTNSNLAG